MGFPKGVTQSLCPRPPLAAQGLCPRPEAIRLLDNFKMNLLSTRTRPKPALRRTARRGIILGHAALARVIELVDIPDLKSVGRKAVPVQVRPRAPGKHKKAAPPCAKRGAAFLVDIRLPGRGGARAWAGAGFSGNAPAGKRAGGAAAMPAGRKAFSRPAAAD